MKSEVNHDKSPGNFNSDAASKHDRIVRTIRNRIVTGNLLPGERLSVRVHIEEQFQASTVTVQRALDQLARDGFVRPDGRRGTFVAFHPPHLCNYALAFEDHPAQENRSWTRFSAALREEATAFGHSPHQDVPRRVRFYYDIQPHADVEDYQRLIADVQNHRLAGIIFVSLAPGIATTPLWDSNVARVCLNAAAEPGIVSVMTDHTAFIQKALDHLRALGRTRVAIVTAGLVEPFVKTFADQAAARGMLTHPYWAQGPTYTTPQAVRNAVHLLFNPSQTQKPDALIITDDHLVDQAGAGLLAAGVRVPEDVAVVAQANFPFPPPSRVPTAVLGFDIRHLLTTAMDTIDSINKGHTPPKTTLVEPIFEEELSHDPKRN